jgi:mRNA-degrading endonuclease YafQ of YafQ-DinJ toxin-antitoxin module
MIRVTESPRFKRAYKHLIQGRPSLEKTFRETLLLFIQDPYDPQLATHKLKGKLKESFAFSLTWKLRVVFSFGEPGTAILEDIGPHDKVY